MKMNTACPVLGQAAAAAAAAEAARGVAGEAKMAARMSESNCETNKQTCSASFSCPVVFGEVILSVLLQLSLFPHLCSAFSLSLFYCFLLVLNHDSQMASEMKQNSFR